MTQSQMRHVPSVEKLTQAAAGSSSLPRAVVAAMAKAEVDQVRTQLQKGAVPEPFEAVAAALTAHLRHLEATALRPVINGTGVILHTNLGRAPLGKKVAGRVAAVASGYCNLEIDLESGERGLRGPLVDALLAVLTGSEAACVVNNCAAAVVLVLRHLCSGSRKEVLISRGELVEIGGGFRVPEIMETSGARLREVGTTNKTTLADYERAINQETAGVLRVHRSNFYQEGFTESPAVEEIARLARRCGLPFIEDLGSGAMVDTASLAPLEHEPTAAESLLAGADLVCVSGDKLFGGPQAGIIAGRAEWVARVRRDPFFRVLRCDKLMLAALQETALEYLNADASPACDLPVLHFLAAPLETLRARARALAAALGPEVSVGEGMSRCGGGTMPRSAIPSATLEIRPCAVRPGPLARALRQGDPPVIAYVADGKVTLDLRTIFPQQDEMLIAALKAAMTASSVD